MTPCIPCPAPVRHAARAIHHYVLRPIGRRVHHAAHHAPRVIVYGCCAAAVGGMGAAVVAPPGGYFPQVPAAAYVPAPGYGGGYGGGGGGGGIGGGGSQGWPEMPSYSGGVGGIGGEGAASIPVYSPASPEMLSVPPSLYSTPPRGTPSVSLHMAPGGASVPEPSSLALLLLPMVALPMLRRTRT